MAANQYPQTPDVLPLIPVRDIVLFPFMRLPLYVGRPRSIKALEVALTGSNLVFFAAQKDIDVTDPEFKDIYQVGCVAEILQHVTSPDGGYRILVQGLRRA